MKKIKNILIPTDFSENAKNAIDFAFDFFKNQDVKITFLNVFHIPVIPTEMPTGIIFQTTEENRKRAKIRLESYCKTVSENHPQFQFDLIVKTEPLSSSCKEVIKEKKIDLVLMGTHGATGLKKVLFGSNTASIIGTCSCPVLAIPEKATFLKMGKILFATDYHQSDLEDIVALVDFAKHFGSEIIIVHISEGKETDNDKMRWFEVLVRTKTDYKKFNFSLLGKSGIIPSLDSFIHNNEVELLAMSTRPRSPFENLFSPSQTKRMVYHTHIPLLAFHTRKARAEN